MSPSLLYGLLPVLLGHVAQAVLYRNPTPPMGWNSYNYYNCYPNETIIKSNAQGLVDLGFPKLGYTRVTPDCGWPAENRTANGSLTWNATTFPSGFIELGQYLHGLGLEFGVYSGAGVYQCGSGDDSGQNPLPASLGHETQDVATFTAWGADFLKYDNCWPNATLYVTYDFNFERTDPWVRFVPMANALNATSREFELEICQWGSGYDLGYWAPTLAETWRVSNDIATKAAGGSNFWGSIWRIANQVVPYTAHTGVGKYPDMDMLIVGLGTLSFEEERFHFSLWAINKSPLVIGAPMDKTITPQQSLDILSNEEIIAIDQDPLAEQAKLIRRYTEEQYDIWAGNLTGDRYVVAVLNWANTSASVNISLLNTIGLANANATRDVWLGKDLGALDGSKELHLELVGHEAKILVLSCVELIVPPPKSRGSTYYSAANATLQNGANITDCSSTPHYCLPTESKVSNLNGTASVMFENVNVAETTRGNTAAALTRVVGVDFINYDIAFTTGDNTRNLTIQVNGGPIKRWAFPISGGDWYETGRLDVELSGFVDGVNNTIVLGAYGTHAAPDIVGLEVYA